MIHTPTLDVIRRHRGRAEILPDGRLKLTAVPGDLADWLRPRARQLQAELRAEQWAGWRWYGSERYWRIDEMYALAYSFRDTLGCEKAARDLCASIRALDEKYHESRDEGDSYLSRYRFAMIEMARAVRDAAADLEGRDLYSAAAGILTRPDRPSEIRAEDFA